MARVPTAAVDAESGVSSQPFSDEETLRGARNRIRNASLKSLGADYVVAFEGGVEWCKFSSARELSCFAWAVVQAHGMEGKSRTATFTLPPVVTELVQSGMELGDADDRVFQRTNSKQENGTVGILTKDILTRETYYRHAVILALIPFTNLELYGQNAGEARSGVSCR
ncbi:hypothetical protein CBR_g49705 [Chara braunii]|uniref:inosine/xanthosine triphosphatase n=1 Tax=Chara braunii TaxID=69332 RepID=A0A388M5N8_CHABU|nr:hypothetical protein CBR_g49705 [Chara braunii]|eukprot:GBG89856.1 hypothetical protein CBR_g49705 [Chara braunii]